MSTKGPKGRGKRPSAAASADASAARDVDAAAEYPGAGPVGGRGLDAAAGPFRVSLLDVGPDEYGDAVLCQFGDKSILIDGSHPGDQNSKGGHPSIPEQLGRLLGQTKTPYRVSLLIVTHAHADHIGCLPSLVRDDTLRADWALAIDPNLGWGRAEGEDRDAGVRDERVRALAAALREEVRTDATDDAALDRLLADAASLEDRYNEMLDTLRQRGTRVVRFGRDSTSALTQAFASAGLKILGPTRAHLLECADVINHTSTDAIRRAADAVGGDADADVPSIYRSLVAATRDATDAQQRPGPAINLQSIVTRFLYRGKKLLFAGDMQFVRPEVSDDVLAKSVAALRKAVQQEAPYAFVKLSHHGSDNAFNEEFMGQLGAGTRLYGICAGELSKSHPNPQTLKVLNQHRQDIQWVRTDHNGLVTIDFSGATPAITKAHGKINDPQPNSSDEMIETGEGAPAAGEGTSGAGEGTSGAGGGAAGLEPGTRVVVGPQAEPAQTQVSASAESVEVHARIPHAATRVTITVDVQPGGAASTAFPTEPPATTTDALQIAGGRRLPQLLFVTSRDSLAANIGRDECAQVLSSIRARGLPLVDDLPRGASDAAAAAASVRARLAQYPNARGVVIVGGYDVVPSAIRDALPPDVRRRLASNDDPDNFVVWSDDLYGARADGAEAQLPVSRVPDGKSARLVFAALAAPGRRPSERRSGVRNVARPFAEGVFTQIPGARQMLVSKETIFNQPDPRVDLLAERVYLMLHGDYVDSSRFWGEGTQQNREAVNVSNVPDGCGPVVFAGCCWGALTVDTPAGLVDPGRPFGQKTPGSSIALTFLAKGATAFVGCTGAHYSPNEPPYRFYGGPMHEAFWRRYNAGEPPALALFNAKRDYAAGIPHGQTGTQSRAIENKILRQYTCLGLGW